MSIENQNLRRRIDALETRLANQERELRTQSERAIGFKWPRERWLGRTTSASPSSYPTSGDTFQVELLSGHFTASEGTQEVTESLRGTKPIARTWPATYLPYGTEVIAERIRGLGPSGAGEWWIQIPPTTPALRKCAWFEGHAYNKNRSTGVANPETHVGALNANDLLLAPQVMAAQSTSTEFFSQAAPGAFGDPWITITAAGVYRLHWQLRAYWPTLAGSYPYGTTPRAVSTGGVVDVWDGILFFSTVSLRLYYQGAADIVPSHDDIGSQSTLWAQWQTNANAPWCDVAGLWQRHVEAGTRLRPVAYVLDSTLGKPYVVARSVASLEQVGPSHA